MFFGSLSAGGITIKRNLAAWEKVTDAVNSVQKKLGSEERTLSEVNTYMQRAWFAKSFNNARPLHYISHSCLLWDNFNLSV